MVTGRRLRMLRKRSLLTLREVQALTGVWRNTISRLEKVKTNLELLPGNRLENVRRLLAFYEVRVRQAERREREWGFAPPAAPPEAPKEGAPDGRTSTEQTA